MHIDPDKWLNGDVGKKLKFNFLLSHLIITYWMFTDFTMMGLFCGFLAYIFIGKIGADIGFHRYFTHKSFEVNSVVRRYIMFASTILGHGSILIWVATHREHHATVDTKDDPHSPLFHGIFAVWTRSWTGANVPNLIRIKDILRDQELVFLHRNYFKVFYIWLSLLLLAWALGSIYPILFLFAFPNAVFFHEAGMVNSICHKYGYKSYHTIKDDNSRNNLIVHFLTLGNGLHNTHHENPRLYTADIHGKWYELDLMKYLIRALSYDRTRVEH